MTIGIIANATKEKVFDVVSLLVNKIKANDLDFLITDTMISKRQSLTEKINKKYFLTDKNIYKRILHNCQLRHNYD